jgi:uncharacterized protein (TIGR02996 family)
MNHEEGFLKALLEDPQDTNQWLIFADWMLERDDPRGELLQHLYALTQNPDLPDRPVREGRLRSLLTQGVHHPGPFRTNALGMSFTWVWPGTFLMGSPPDEPERGDDEMQHRVTLTRGFWLGVTPVTQEQWQAVMGSNPSRFREEHNLPVERVSWESCQKCCDKLTQVAGTTCRLPTEAEWEYACRGGTTTPFHFGVTISTDQANYDGRHVYAGGCKGIHRWKTTPASTFPANAWGLRDMHGNVWEWCLDWYGDYDDSVVTDPRGSKGGESRILRGGCWDYIPSCCRAACRLSRTPARRLGNLGFRVVLCQD